LLICCVTGAESAFWRFYFAAGFRLCRFSCTGFMVDLAKLGLCGLVLSARCASQIRSMRFVRDFFWCPIPVPALVDSISSQRFSASVPRHRIWSSLVLRSFHFALYSFSCPIWSVVACRDFSSFRPESTARRFVSHPCCR
jgi:hypothetical protein